ncbi:MAG: hypothetical protein EBZ47_01660 [Chlamydiae bacterium]|nr:hypothetical protein [Chlamydiota bacterium]
MSTYIIDVKEGYSNIVFFQNDQLRDIHLNSYSNICDLIRFIKDVSNHSKILITSSCLLEDKKIAEELKTSYHSAYFLQDILHQLPIPFHTLEPKDLRSLANFYGALKRFPLNDCLIVDLGTENRFDLFSKEGLYLAGSICTFPAKFQTEKPIFSMEQTHQEKIETGVYYGLLGSIERISQELSLSTPSPSSVKILATGNILFNKEDANKQSNSPFIKDLQEIVDDICPHLTFLGLNEIFKEFLLKQQEK